MSDKNEGDKKTNKSKTKTDWDWYFKEGGLDKLTKFDDRNTGHDSYAYQDAGGDDYLDSIEKDLQQQQQQHFGDDDDDIADMASSSSDVNPFAEDIFKKVLEKNRSDWDYWSGGQSSCSASKAPSYASDYSSVGNLRGRGRGQRVQERRRRHQVGRAHEYVEGTNMGVEIEAFRDMLSASDLGSEGNKALYYRYQFIITFVIFANDYP